MNDPTPTDRVRLSVLPRRQLLRDTAFLAGGAVATGAVFPAGALAAGVVPERVAAWLELVAQGTPAALDSYEPVALTSGELETLKAALARIIPADDLGPGAVEAGTFVFIDRSLAGANADTLPIYQVGLAALDAAAGSDGFAALDDGKRDDLLTQAESDELADIPPGFFALLLEHTRQGMFGDPIYGGNRDFVGWDLIRYPGIKLVWTEEEQEINVDVEPAHTSVAEFGGDPS
jgi:gluconate 2-dehydrogenase gamma chain